MKPFKFEAGLHPSPILLVPYSAMKRRLLKLGFLLLLGATLNVAVAWGCLLKSRIQAAHGQPLSSEYLRWWVKNTPQNFVRKPTTLHCGSAFGHEYAMMMGPTLTRADVMGHVAFVNRCGWPLRSAEAYRLVNHEAGTLIQTGITIRGGQYDGHSLPTRLLFPGFAVNTLFYAGALWVLLAGPFALRRMIRRRHGCCPQCAYPIDQSPICTECGAAVSSQDSNPSIQLDLRNDSRMI